MRVEDALFGLTWVYVETAPFIYYTEKKPIYFARVARIFAYVDRDELEVVTSALTLAETLNKPIENNDQALVAQYRALFYRTANIYLEPISPQIAEQAAFLRAQYKLKTPDALHMACALEQKAEAFLTNDIGFRRVQGIPVLILDELS